MVLDCFLLIIVHVFECTGNNNGNPNDDAPAYVVDGGLDRLFKSQQITRDLWAWQPPAVLPQGDALPPYAKECPYIEPTYLTPTIVYPGTLNTDCSCFIYWFT
jgi:hypothetical protein